ncbi:uncharacterized protein N7479_008086 [Penicillium vulpinum]|uniref:Uncharacterized protein n=1 Tax=Penicillium vulpinum TaxID=29845 RepID=A0A1V6R3V8_9EURO|nr:uncharacterized protein N7479_008086 [Penicillium vulpinum]KAJ5960936.1 hypothetical protein N7479_008086 [Penicillium vulpinum]OQD95977.1 hypothetical protein PENVUL_c100G04474 [Penicillium vulpinum]
MAPILGFVDVSTLSPRAVKQYEANMEKENSIATLLLVIIVIIGAIALGGTFYCLIKPKCEEKWKPKLKPKLRDYKKKCEGWKKMVGDWHIPKELRAPEPAHVAARPVPEAPEVKQITRDLTPEYMKMSTAGIL